MDLRSVCALVNAYVLGAVTARSTTARTPAARASRSGPAAPSGQLTSEQRGPRGIRGVLAPAVDNWLSRGYLAVVAASLGFFLHATYVLRDAGFAAIWPVMATAPFSILALLPAGPAEYCLSLPWLGSLILLTGVALSGLIDASPAGCAPEHHTRPPADSDAVRGPKHPRLRPLHRTTGA